MQDTGLKRDWTVYSGNVVALPQRVAAYPLPAPAEGLLASGLDALGQGVAILAADGRLVHANASLRAFAARNDGLGLDDRGIVSADLSAQSRLGDAIWVAVAAAENTLRQLPYPARIALPRRNGGVPWLVQVQPLKADSAGRTPGAMLVVTDPLGRLPPLSQLCRVLGLDRAEAELACGLAAGDSQAAIARRRGVSPRSLRCQVAALRCRLGCATTAQLIGLVLTLGD